MRLTSPLWLLPCLWLACARTPSTADDGQAEPAPTLPAIDCDALASCPDTPCPEGQGCYMLDACEGARCMPNDEVCQRVCGVPQCAVMESYPMQLGCDDGATKGGATAPPTTENPCAEAEAALQRELKQIQSCSAAEECGQVLEGSSCGCTRNLVARNDADLGAYEARRRELAELGCGGMASTCDCPAADGYACVEGSCTWNYQ